MTVPRRCSPRHTAGRRPESAQFLSQSISLVGQRKYSIYLAGVVSSSKAVPRIGDHGYCIGSGIHRVVALRRGCEAGVWVRAQLTGSSRASHKWASQRGRVAADRDTKAGNVGSRSRGAGRVGRPGHPKLLVNS
jgi:hypothetical protein